MQSYDGPGVQALADRLNSPDPGVRRVAVLDLVDLGGEEAAELLAVALKDSDVAVRQEAAKVVDEFDAEDIADALLGALGDPDELVRNAAASSLADLKDPNAARSLLSALEISDDPFVVAAVLGALKPLRAAEAEAPALRLLHHEDPRVRREAVAVLGWLKRERNVPALLAQASRDDDPEVRRVTASALLFAPPLQVGPTLVEMMQDTHWQVRAEASASIGKIEYKAGTRALMKATADSFWQVRERAAEALGKLQAVEAIDTLGACAQDPSSNLRKAAVGALGEIGHADCRPFVETALDDPDPDVRKLARWAKSQLEAVA